MRFPSIPTLIRTFSFYNLTSVRLLPASYQGVARGVTLRSMPTLPFLGGLFGQGQDQVKEKDMGDFPVKKTQEKWQTDLSEGQYYVLRKKGTEPAFTGEYDKHMPSEGIYQCAGCDAPLYRANHKFKSGCGWPAYYDNIPGAVIRHTDRTLGMSRTEIVCSKCGGHLGHVFKGEGYPTPTDERHCVNSISLMYNPKNEADIEKKE